MKQSYYFTVITSSKSLQAKISSSNSIFMKRYVNTPSSPSPGVSYIFLAVKHLRMGAKQEPYMSLSECETLNSVPKRWMQEQLCCPSKHLCGSFALPTAELRCFTTHTFITSESQTFYQLNTQNGQSGKMS